VANNLEMPSRGLRQANFVGQESMENEREDRTTSRQDRQECKRGFRIDDTATSRGGALFQFVGDLSEAGSSARFVLVAAGSAADSNRANRIVSDFDR